MSLTERISTLEMYFCYDNNNNNDNNDKKKKKKKKKKKNYYYYHVSMPVDITLCICM